MVLAPAAFATRFSCSCHESLMPMIPMARRKSNRRDLGTNRGADGLARPALADDRRCLALLDGIGHPVDGAHNSRTGSELGVQILDLQEWCQDPSRCSPSGYSF